jgi:hypothetical protein
MTARGVQRPFPFSAAGDGTRLVAAGGLAGYRLALAGWLAAHKAVLCEEGLASRSPEKARSSSLDMSLVSEMLFGLGVLLMTKSKWLRRSFWARSVVKGHAVECTFDGATQKVKELKPSSLNKPA